MDANGTHFHLLLGRADWATCTVGRTPLHDLWDSSPPHANLSELAWNDERAELTLRARLFRFTAAPKDTVPTLSNRRGAGRDRYGNWYWIDETGREIQVNSAGTHVTSHFWSAGDGVACEPAARFGEFQAKDVVPPSLPLQLSGLVVTEDHYLVVGVREPTGLLIFDLHASGPPQQVLWPPEVAFVPFDMAPRPGGGVWILDRIHRCYWALDRHFNIINPQHEEIVLAEAQRDDFQPRDPGRTRGTPRQTFPRSLSLLLSSPLSAHDPIAVEALPDGTVLILDNNALTLDFSAISRYRLAQQLGKPVSTNVVLDVVEEDTRADFRLVGYDFAFVPEHIELDGTSLPDRLYVVDASGNQSFAFDLSQSDDQLILHPVPAYLPMRLFGGKGLVAAGTSGYYDFGDGWIPLVEQRRPRYASEAILSTPRFDGNDPDCVWHRLMLDACIPPETEVQVWSRTANDERDLELSEWQEEPHPYLRGDGSELPFLRRRLENDGQQTKRVADGTGTWELLFQRACGRFLQLKLRLSGNERTTPRLRALRAYYPRFSYLAHYLPAVYREDEQSASFLDRFLANLEGFYTALEDKIASVQMLFDVRSAPADVLEWLAGWFGVAIDPAWDETRRGLFIAHAMEFFQYRGTIPGLLMALRLVLESCPDETIFTDPFTQHSRSSAIRIVEKYRTRRTPGVVFGDPTEQSGLRVVAPTDRWQPAQGKDRLHQRYREFLAASGLSPGEGDQFPLKPSEKEAAAWRQFARDVLGFVPAATPADQPRWQDFLARRYQRIGALNTAYGANWTAFDSVPLSDRVPQDGAPLLDWYQFESVVLAMQRTAHRFTVLLPAPQTDTADAAEHRRRLGLTQRIINLEKPVHTIFDVKFYWAVFRVGEVRLGEDTIIDLGSRALRFLPPLVVGQGYLSESFLAPGHPYDVVDRQIVGRDRVSGSSPV